MENFREDVLQLAGKGLQIMAGFFEGDECDATKIEKAASMIREGVKVSNRDQVDAQVKKSQALKLLSHIPKELRAEYIALSNPEAKPFLLSRPKKED